MSHQDSYYKENETYARFLSGWDPAFYGKYVDTLAPDWPKGCALDVGCGVGQVVHQLDKKGVAAHGVDVSQPNIEKAREISERVQTYDGKKLPFEDGHFDSVGALNVLEHVDEPEAFIADLIRVAKPGGKIVISSPNFLRTLGYRDYHYRMRGVANKFANLKRLIAKRSQMKSDPDSVRFERMEPVIRENFQPDDDAIVVTNMLEMMFFLQRNGCHIERNQCTDRYVHGLVDFCLNLTFTKYMMFNSFIVARKN
ncbi:MAG: class I SAM-dependent methyltransferase [Verrucomicrobiia bacterium]|jgi:SAM-dependent methyltransferase